ncbi:hypothetical protein L8C07_06025 [Paenibacillus sp. CMAA1739]|uniref:hypothetical protein n=1 Tax=Paenibacillus ottowii TaxID=2315729 RepID=UPI002DB6CDAF|nr:hypothetical protein [Paenibacillus sp. CMAA1739]MEC4565497.1 hypothetical protein [Paenibacillus sp. CMAA1739]
MTLKDLIIEALNEGVVRAQSVNKGLMELSKASRKKSGFLKIAVTDEDAARLMRGGKSDVGILLYIDRDKFDSLANKEV